MKCPVCGGRPARIYKCTSCGEVRCGQDSCTGSLEGPVGWAGAGSLCRACGEGRYGAISFLSPEVEQLEREFEQRRKDKLLGKLHPKK